MTESVESAKGPYTNHTDQERERILEVIGEPSLDSLLTSIGIPQGELRYPDLNLGPALTEFEVEEQIEAIASANDSLYGKDCYLGVGSYRGFIPAAVDAIASNRKFSTSYTPYQPEVAQGTLQYTYELERNVGKLLGMPLVGAGVYSGATAAGEAARMAIRITDRRVVGILDDVDPNIKEVVTTYVRAMNAEVQEIPSKEPDKIGNDLACVLVQQPNSVGTIQDLERLATIIHEKGALMAVSADPVFSALFDPPGKFDADIVVAEGQSLGINPRFGGSYYGIFSCRREYAREIPGRLVEETMDSRGRRGYVLTLTNREQYGGREKATSNLTTAAALNGLRVAAYLALMGDFGLRHVAYLSYHRAHHTASKIAALNGYSILNEGDFFRSFLVQTPIPAEQVNNHLLKANIIGGYPIDEDKMIMTVTEMNRSSGIDKLVAEMRKAVA